MAEPLGVPKGQFLQSVRQALQQGGPVSTEPGPSCMRLGERLAELEAQAREIEHRTTRNLPALLDRLCTVAQLRGWRIYRTTEPEEAIDYVRSVATSSGTRKVVRSHQEVFRDVPVDHGLRGLGLEVITVAKDWPQEKLSAGDSRGSAKRDFRLEMAAAGLGITGADYAVAETGSVVLVPGKGLSRLVSVLPPVHLALVRPQEVVETLDDLFLLRRLDYYRNGGDMGSYLNFITGPSRTADIEQTLVVGVHGPKEVHLVLLG